MTCMVEDDITVDAERVEDARLNRVFEALEQLAAADVESMDRQSLDGVSAVRRTVVAFCDAIDIRIARRSRQLAAEGRSEPPADVLRERGRRSGRDAAAAASREVACEQLPTFEGALGDGSVTAGHLDALATATGKLNDTDRAEFASHEGDLLKHAKKNSVEAFERECRDLGRIIAAKNGDDGRSELERQREKNNIRQWVDRNTGMGHLHAELDPESHALVWSAINSRLRTLKHQQDERGADDPVASLTHAQLEAKALVDLITGSGALGRRVPEVIVLIDYDTLVGALRDDSVCETSNGFVVTPATVRRYCCEAGIVPTVLGSDGEVLDVGAAARLATPAQRRATLAMYRTCTFPACQVPVDRCEIHHVDDWLHHRRTNLGGLAPLCCQHHHLIHEGGWTITMTPDRTITITRPDGTHYFTGITTDRQTRSTESG
ncbi:MAG: HNH endonuclease [Actinomycetota bacterium]|nr:HNH endonuclease [Actinomycetota bacterium]